MKRLCMSCATGARRFAALVMFSCCLSAVAQQQEQEQKPESVQKSEASSAQKKQSTAAQQKQKKAPAIDPAAMAALDKMGAYLRTLTAFEVSAATSTDALLENGIKVQLDGKARLLARRPDRLRLEVESDRKARQFFFDGQNFTIFGPRVNYYATVPAPPTTGELVRQLASKYGIEMPLADLFLWGSDQAHPEDVKAAYHLGPATIDGAATEHYVFRQKGVDWQVWIQQGDAPLPRKLVVTTTSVAAQPASSMLLRWNLAPQINEEMFAFHPPAQAMKIKLQTLDGMATAGDKKAPDRKAN